MPAVYVPTKLAQAAPSTTAATTIYTVPGGRTTTVKNIIVANVTAAAATATISFVPGGGTAGAANRIMHSVVVQPNALVTLDLTQVLNAGDFISVQVGTANALVFTISGVELQTITFPADGLQVGEAGALLSTRPFLNFIEGANITLTVADNPGANRSDVTVAVAGSVAIAPILRTYTASATWTKPAGLKFVRVRMVGGGGSGGGTAATAAGQVAAGGGGAGGGYSEKLIAAAALGATEAVTVGAGGAGATAGANTGNAGGTSSFGAHCSAGGGGGGAGMAAQTATASVNGGSPGAGTGGDFNSYGEAGEYGVVIGTGNIRTNRGGGTVLGGYSRQTLTVPGAGGVNPNTGQGSPGAQANASAAAQASLAGADGVVLVEEHYA